jgi:ribosomal protein S18 acetylase RimI-like enzyme
MEVNVRRATEDDYEALCELWAQADGYHAAALPQVFRRPEGYARARAFVTAAVADQETGFFVAELSGQVIGLVRVTIRRAPDVPCFVPRRYAFIEEVVVREGFRGRGFGRLLLEHAHRWARQHGVDQIELSVYEFNTGAIRLYQQLGYATLSRRMVCSLA